MTSPVICLVTLHGIGFQQPPLPGIAGYADSLHTNLSMFLDETILGDDPYRQRTQRGENGPIYVHSCWPPDTSMREAGLSRLGSWGKYRPEGLDISSAPLIDGNGRIVHVALVYSHLQEQGPPPGISLTTNTISLGLSGYVSGLARMLFLDMQILPSRETTSVTPSLRVRRDPGFEPDKPINVNQSPSGLLAVTRQLENDIANYVCRNDLRESVRSFVLDALTRLALREDVTGLVINALSNGSVIALDVLRQLPAVAFSKVKVFVTTGSPLRKYIDLFSWGRQIENMHTIKRWINFWDAKDPIADPLIPPIDWRRGSGTWSTQEPTLFYTIDPNTGVISNINIEDRIVDNISNSFGSGLQAHNYWDNQKEFVMPLANLLRQLVTSQDML